MLLNKATVTRLWAETLERPWNWNAAIAVVGISAVIRHTNPRDGRSENY